MNRILLLSLQLFAFLTILPCQSFARIGDTLEECNTRYKPFNFFNAKGGHSFYKDGIVIVTYFFDGKVDKIRYFKFDTGASEDALFTNLSDSEIQTLLKDNGGARKWVKRKDGVWETEDRALFASPDDDYTNIWIYTRARLEREIAKKEEQNAK